LNCFKFGRVTNDLDYKDLREIIIHRAINMCNGIKNFGNDKDSLNYVISRNFLDILTVYSWYEGLEKYNYRARLSSASETTVDFSKALISELHVSLEHKLDPENCNVSSPDARLETYWKELARLADYVEIWNDSNKVNFHGSSVYLHKLRYWAKHTKRFKFLHSFISQKKPLLRLILESASLDPFLHSSNSSSVSFGLKDSENNSNLLFDISDIAKFHYPYLAKKNG
jgi:hypothetical protein